MPSFGESSRIALETCHIGLQQLALEVVKVYDCSVLEGHRDKLMQDIYFHRGFSKVKWPNSKHNLNPSLAIHLVPWFVKKPHIRWSDTAKFYQFSGVVIAVAHRLNLSIRFGGNWDGDEDLHDSEFLDLAHWETQ